jgi:hypothetical protein
MNMTKFELRPILTLKMHIARSSRMPGILTLIMTVLVYYLSSATVYVMKLRGNVLFSNSNVIFLCKYEVRLYTGLLILSFDWAYWNYDGSKMEVEWKCVFRVKVHILDSIRIELE